MPDFKCTIRRLMMIIDGMTSLVTLLTTWWHFLFLKRANLISDDLCSRNYNLKYDLCEITTKTMRERSATISSCTPILITSYQRAGDLQKTTFLICLCIYPLLRNSYKISYLIEEFSVNLPHVFDSSQTLTLTKQ